MNCVSYVCGQNMCSQTRKAVLQHVLQYSLSMCIKLSKFHYLASNNPEFK